MNKFVDMIYAAASDSSKWQVFLQAFAGATNARGAAFFVRDLGRTDLSTNCWYGWSEDDILTYGRYAADDPWARGAERLSEGEVGPDTLACSREEAEGSVAWREFYLPRDRCHGFSGIILRTPTSFSTISLVRGKDPGPFEEHEIGLLRELMPHLRRAALLHGELASLRAHLEAFTGHLDRYPHALCFLDEERRVLYSNSAAAELLRNADPLHVEDGRLSTGFPKEDIALHEAMREGLREAESRVSVVRVSANATCRVLFLPLSNSDLIRFGSPKPVAAAVILDSRLPWLPDAALLRELFRFTRTESIVAGKLAQGYQMDGIAKQLGISVETVRTHVRRAMAKTGKNRQGALVSLVLQSAPFRRQEEKYST